MDKWDLCSFAYLNKPSWWHFFHEIKIFVSSPLALQRSKFIMNHDCYPHRSISTMNKGASKIRWTSNLRRHIFIFFNNQHRWCSLNWNCRFLYQFLFFDISLLFYWRLFLLVIPFFSFHDIFKAVVMAIKVTLANGIFFMKELRIVSRIIFAHFEETGKILSLSK